MILLQTLFSHLSSSILHTTLTVSHFEAETLHIPPSLRFFTTGTDPDHLFRQGFLFLLAPFHAFITLPLADYLWPKDEVSTWRDRVWRSLGCYAEFFGMFWGAILVVSANLKRLMGKG
jgi:hypothetical protein